MCRWCLCVKKSIFWSGTSKLNRPDSATGSSLTCCALEDEAEAKRLAKQHAVFYLGGMGTYYRDNLARQGHEEVANAIYDNYQDGDREAAMEALPDDLLEQLVVWGTPEGAREHFDRFTDVEGVEAVSVSFPRAANLEQIESTMRALQPR